MTNPSGTWAKAALVGLGMAVGFVGGCRLAGQQAPGAHAPPAAAEEQVALNEVPAVPVTASAAGRETPVVRAVRKVTPAVVNISTEKTVTRSAHPFRGFFEDDPFFERFFSDVFPKREFQQNTLGSGVIVDETGIVLTNQHVLLPASKILCTTPDGTTYTATLMGADTTFDIAILQLEGGNTFPHAPMGKSDDLMIGETVIAIGNPFGLESSVTTGVISALDRSVRISKDRVYNGFIQTDALINPGNSGGPLVNIDGEVIGINTAIYNQAQGIGFAIPVQKAQRIMDQLRTYGQVKRGWLGIRVKDMDPDVRTHFQLPPQTGAVLVTGVQSGSPPAKAGIEAGDVLVKVQGKSVASRSDFYEATSDLIVNDDVSLTLWHDATTRDVTVRAQEITPEGALKVLENLVGAGLSFVDDRVQRERDLFTNEGLVVDAVTTGGQAHHIGIRQGDVLRRVDNVSLKGPKDVQDAVNLAYGKASFVVLVQRGRQGYWVTFEN